ncbi:glycosyl transferase family 2 [Rippkaea orientalis PCC 8801]|uniref:Probable UDP-N-acetylglucosamine--peptide N-acetylglucosaminyltransferase SPINDLY n=1 Tax=Rippkaea orientalis (strain PCC 8801 / RF-1) TaxID=41431 RepID=B7JYD8_RIPO1|nr:tetratricopeptide repeat protein [Rippkaea orientalis]ACK67240.1 glycosyl transferase family 2 [Rippkaea orientalis PCC 8801]
MSTNNSSFPVEALLKTAIAKHQGNQLTEAESLYRQILYIVSEDPLSQNLLDKQDTQAMILNNLGIVLQEKQQFEESINCYYQALSIKPNWADVHNDLGIAFEKLDNLEEAFQHYQKALTLNPNLAQASFNIGNILYQRGYFEEALTYYQKALEINPDFNLAHFALLMKQIPYIYSSYDDLQFRRTNYQNYLQHLVKIVQKASLEEKNNLAKAVGSSQPFFLPYQGLNDRDLQQIYGNLICHLMASLYPQWSQPLALSTLEVNRKIRIGFVSGFFHNHSVWKIPLKGWVRNLDRSRFELFAYYTSYKEDGETFIASRSFDKFIQGHRTIEQWCQTIVEDKLHALIFPEIGMDTVTTQIACLRLAPIQMTSWGHPNTSGMPTIDYYLSSDLMESDTAQDYYTEKLVRLPNLSIYYNPLEYVQPKAISKEDIGLKVDDVMFWCCQSLYKYLPQHDDVFPKIAQQLPNSKFVFIEGQKNIKNITEIFVQRLRKSFEQFGLNYQDYCIFLPRMDVPTFAGTAAIADINLDSLGWSGCNSTLESIAHNIPVVTFAADFMRGRHTMAILKMIGIEETIASSKDNYIEIAVHLGKAPQYRQFISQKIAQNKYKLYSDFQPVIALENFISNAVYQKSIQYAIQLHRANDLTGAKEAYNRILARETKHPDSLYGLGVLAHQIGEFDYAEQLFNDLLKVQPKSAKAWMSLGNLYQEKKQFSQAINAYQQALFLEPNLVAVYNNLGYVLQQQSQWEEAISCYQKALEIQPNCVEAEINLANVLHSQNKLPPEQQIQYAQLNLQLGIKQEQQGNLATAIECYQQGIKLQPESAEIYHNLGVAWQKQGKLEEAIAAYQNALDLNPQQGKTYFSLGQIYQVQNQLKKASSAYQKGLKLINPHYAKAIAATEIKTRLSQQITPEFSEQTVTIGGHNFPAIPTISEGDKKRPFWSVVIPIYNRTQYILECLASVLAQWPGEDEMEILVIDDASSIPIAELIEDIGGGIVNYYRNPKNRGQSKNVNGGISLSRGQWIHVLHDDDLILPGFYAQLKKSLEGCSESVGAAFTGYENINEKQEIIFYQQPYGEYRGIAQNWLEKIGVFNPLNVPAVVIRRETYEHLGGYHSDLNYTTDWELYKRIASFYDWWVEPQILARYRQHSASVTQEMFEIGTQAKCIRKAIDISEAYLPSDRCLEITEKSRRHYFNYCLELAAILLKKGKIKETFYLVQEILKIDQSPQALEQLFCWLNQEQARSIRDEIASQLINRT